MMIITTSGGTTLRAIVAAICFGFVFAAGRPGRAMILLFKGDGGTPVAGAFRAIAGMDF
jgi:uncharacterized membrane-anchored protein